MCTDCRCVVVAHEGDSVHVTDSKLGDQSPVITIPLERWEATLPADWFVKDGDWYLFRDPANRLSPALQFDQGEYEVFVKEQAELRA